MDVKSILVAKFGLGLMEVSVAQGIDSLKNWFMIQYVGWAEQREAQQQTVS